MSQFLQNISFYYSSSSHPLGEYFSCKKQAGTRDLTFFHSADMCSSHNNFTWDITLNQIEQHALAAALWHIIDQSPLAKETAMIEDGCPKSISIECNSEKIDHDWVTFSDHEVITRFSRLIGELSFKPHTKRKLRPLPDLAV